MTACDLTIVVVNDAEKEPALLGYCTKALAEYNADAIGRCQVVVLNQDPLASPWVGMEDVWDDRIEWHDAGHRVVDGAVLWDLVESLRLLRPKIRGRYLMLLHKEMVCLGGSISGLLDYAERAGYPHVVLHNLRRPGGVEDIRQHGQVQCSAEWSRFIRLMMDQDDPASLSDVPDVHWIPSRDEQAVMSIQRWIEDVFAARVDFLDAVRFFEHGRPHLFFQDVYDLMGVVDSELARRDLAATVRRLPLSKGRILHLHHPRCYPALVSPAVERFFCAGAGSHVVAGTLLGEPATFHGVRQWVGNPCEETVRHHRHPRHSTGGTVDRYRTDFCKWLDSRGDLLMREYYGQPSPATVNIRHCLSVGPGPVLLVAHNRDIKNRLHPLHAARIGLEASGRKVEIVQPPPPGAMCWPLVASRPGAVVTWNAAKDVRAQIAARFRSEGVPVFVMERGFFARMRFSQVDPCGFGHTASWASREQLSGSPPPEGQARFVGSFGTDVSLMAPREKGIILVLGQIAGDAQLADSEISASEQLEQAVMDALCDSALPSLVEFRPHPLTPAGRRNTEPLREAIARSRFAVTINSNSIHEALAWGCPVLALGPALACIAGVAIQTTLANLERSLYAMNDGWAPPPDAVRDYLYTLACRQHSLEELATGEYWKKRLGTRD